MKKKFTIRGAVVGFLCGAGVIAYLYIRVPGVPGLPELLLNVVMVGAFTFAGAVPGFLVGLLVGKK